MPEKSYIISLLILSVFSLELIAQDSISEKSGSVYPRKNAVYFEAMGNAAVWSVNYDRILPIKNGFALLLRAGGNEYHSQDTDELSFNLLGAAGMLYGSRIHFFETTFGYTYFSGSPDRLMNLTAGYRLMGREGLLIRVSPMYIVNTEKGDTFGNNIWAGLSIGYSF